MQFAIRIGTSSGKFARLLIVASAFVLGGIVLGLVEAPVSGWIPALIGLIVAAVAFYRRFARPVVMTIDQAGIRVPRQIQLLPWERIDDIRPATRLGFAPFLIVRTINPKTIPGFATARKTAGPLAPKTEPDEIALNLAGSDARLDELFQAVQRVRELLAEARTPEPEYDDEDEEYYEPPQPVDPRTDPVVQRVADTNATVVGPLRWLLTLFGPVFGLFALWALLAMTSLGDLMGMLIVIGSLALIWLVVALILMFRTTTADRCPSCKLPVRYFKAHAGRPLTCPPCRHVWPAGRFKLR